MNDHRSATPFEHEPVMVAEIVELFSTTPAGTVLDATVGGGGHARAVLAAHRHLDLVGIDRDQLAVDAATIAVAPFGDRARIRRGRFADLSQTLDALGVSSLAAVLFDLGVSSPQLDQAERGFSFRHDGPLDMRMDRDQALSAAQVVNDYTVAELVSVLRRYGDERFAPGIARAIVAARPIATTVELAEIVRGAIPAPARRRGPHAARRTFQAIRIEVNSELAQLPSALDDAFGRLVPGGRGAVLAYHSGEDRIVKERIAFGETGGCTCPPRLPCACGAQATLRALFRGARRPSAAETERNPRAASARMRAVERLSRP